MKTTTKDNCQLIFGKKDIQAYISAVLFKLPKCPVIHCIAAGPTAITIATSVVSILRAEVSDISLQSVHGNALLTFDLKDSNLAKDAIFESKMQAGGKL